MLTYWPVRTNRAHGPYIRLCVRTVRTASAYRSLLNVLNSAVTVWTCIASKHIKFKKIKDEKLLKFEK